MRWLKIKIQILKIPWQKFSNFFWLSNENLQIAKNHSADGSAGIREILQRQFFY